MRAAFASCLVLALGPLAAAIVYGCEGVPDLTFAGSNEDATAPASVPIVDATVSPADATSGSTGPEDSSSSTPSDDAPIAADDAPPGPVLPDDAATPPAPGDGAPPPATGCPSKPPPGTTCCGAVACKGNQQQCNCGLCAYCASEGYCCPSTQHPPGFCANQLSDCH